VPTNIRLVSFASVAIDTTSADEKLFLASIIDFDSKVAPPSDERANETAGIEAPPSFGSEHPDSNGTAINITPNAIFFIEKYIIENLFEASIARKYFFDKEFCLPCAPHTKKKP
jgi:hypothetical protein